MKPQLRHRKVFDIFRDECAVVRDGYGGDAGVLKRERPAALRVARLQTPGLLGYFCGDGKKKEALHECLRSSFLMWTHAGIDSCKCKPARSKRLALVREVIDEEMSVIALAERVHNN